MSIFSISIIMHPARKQYREYFLKELGDTTLICMDDGCGVVENTKRAWNMYDKNCQYHLVLNDDVLLCSNFKQLVEGILKFDCAYSLYFGFRNNYRALIKAIYETNKVDCYINRWLHFGIAVILPTKYIPDLFEYFKTSECGVGLPDNKNADTRIARFIKKKRLFVYYPIPSLVDHRPEKSIVYGTNAQERKAFYFRDRK